MIVNGTSFNVETLKGKTEAQIRKEKSGKPEDLVEALISALKKEGLLKTRKKKDVEEGGE